jgi:hypothetical protein
MDTLEPYLLEGGWDSLKIRFLVLFGAQKKCLWRRLIRRILDFEGVCEYIYICGTTRTFIHNDNCPIG